MSHIASTSLALLSVKYILESSFLLRSFFSIWFCVPAPMVASTSKHVAHTAPVLYFLGLAVKQLIFSCEKAAQNPYFLFCLLIQQFIIKLANRQFDSMHNERIVKSSCHKFLWAIVQSNNTESSKWTSYTSTKAQIRYELQKSTQVSFCTQAYLKPTRIRFQQQKFSSAK